MNPNPLNMTLDQKIEHLKQLRGQIFDLANTFAGKETGHVAVQLHGAANIVSYVRKQVEYFRERTELPESSAMFMLSVVNCSRQLEKVSHLEEMNQITEKLLVDNVD